MKLSSKNIICLALAFTASSAMAAISDCKNPYELSLTGKVSMKFCEIPAAENVLIPGRLTRYEKEVKTPQYRKYFKSFQLGQYTVTQAQYKTIVGEPWKKDGVLRNNVLEGDDQPAVYVPYLDAKMFIEALNQIDPNATYRFPTSAELEYAANARTSSEFYWGSVIDGNYVYFSGNNLDSNENYAKAVTSCPNQQLDARFPGYCANPFGLMHMLGNVAQWTSTPSYRSCKNSKSGNVDNIVLAEYEKQFPEVEVFGGSWDSEVEKINSYSHTVYSISYNRDWDFQNHSYRPYRLSEFPHVGFRVVRIPK